MSRYTVATLYINGIAVFTSHNKRVGLAQESSRDEIIVETM